MKTLFTSGQGYLLIIVYSMIMIGLTLLFTWGFRHTKEFFLVANRRIKRWPLALSITATWIWAPALFVSAQKAYQQGLTGLFWFTVPNAGCLILFGLFIPQIQKRIPKGYTLSGYIKDRFSDRANSVFLVELAGLGNDQRR